MNRTPFAAADARLYQDAVARFGESLYLYDLDFLRGHCAALRAALPADVDIVYSVKANPNPHLIRAALGTLQGVEVSSEGELAMAMAAGIDPSAILLIGPAKGADEITFGVTRGVRGIVVESAAELARVSEACAAQDATARVLVRLNPDFKSSGSRLQMSGAATQFGVEPDAAVAIVRAIQADPRLRWAGVHVYTGTRILDAAAIVENCRQVLDLAMRLGDAVGEPPRTIDFGGGLGVAYFDNERPLDLHALATGLDALLAPYRRSHPGTQYIIETGRYVVAECGLFLTAIRQIKRSKGADWVLTAGGTNQFAAHTFMGPLMRRNFPMRVVTRPGALADHTYTVCGPLCTPSDILGTGVRLPTVTGDDLIAIGNAGAYGYSNAALGFLSHTTPAEVALEDGRLRLLRHAQGPDALLAQMTPMETTR